MTTHPVVCFGEVLWDILPYKTLPGGASMNVTYHLKKLGLNPALITKVGIDDYGEKLVNLLSENDIATEYFQVDYDHPTGLVHAEPKEDNEVVYDIVFPSAWDFIQWEEEFVPLIKQADYFVFGSLTSRNKASRDTLYQALEVAKTKVLDINLRPPHYNRCIVEHLLSKTDILKMNIAELELITGWFSHFRDTNDRVKSLQDKFNIETVIVTMGEEGAWVNDKGQIYRHTGFKVQVADTIGSGDAFLAGFLYENINGTSTFDALAFACGLGAFVATCSGACPRYETDEIAALIHTDQLQKL